MPKMKNKMSLPKRGKICMNNKKNRNQIWMKKQIWIKRKNIYKCAAHNKVTNKTRK